MLNFSQAAQNTQNADAKKETEPRRITDRAEATPVEVIPGPIIDGQQSFEMRANGKVIH